MRKYLLTTRPVKKAFSEVRSDCFDLVNIPVTELKPIENFDVSRVVDFDPEVVIFTSSYSVELYFDYFKGNFANKVLFISIGNETERALNKRGKKSVVPEIRTSSGIIQYLSEVVPNGKKISLFVSSKSNGVIQSYLEKEGRLHQVNILYTSEPVSGKELVERVFHSDCFGLVVTSSYEARALFEGVLNSRETDRLSKKKKIFSIGKTTSKELDRLGIPVSLPEGESDLQELIKEIDRKYCVSK